MRCTPATMGWCSMIFSKKNMIDLDYYINVYDLMMIDLPRPRPKNNDFFEDNVEIPIILVESGE